MSKKKENQQKPDKISNYPAGQSFLKNTQATRTNKKAGTGISIRSFKRPILKTKEEILQAQWEELNFDEKMLRSQFERNPDISLKEAKEALDMIP